MTISRCWKIKCGWALQQAEESTFYLKAITHNLKNRLILLQVLISGATLMTPTSLPKLIFLVIFFLLIPEHSDCRDYNIENESFHKEFEGNGLEMELKSPDTQFGVVSLRWMSLRLNKVCSLQLDIPKFKI